jgi:hypothetical protein
MAHPAPADEWVAELPSVQDVRAAIHGADAADTTARQTAALSILLDYVHTNRSSLPPAAKQEALKRSAEYFNSESAWTAAVERYSKDGPFQREVLTRWLSSERQRLEVERQTQQQARDDERDARQAAEETLRRAAADRKDAQTAHVDLNVFGIPLGEPMRLPDCPESDSDDNGTCIVRKVSTFNQMMAAMSAVMTSVPWATKALPVRLAHSACPDWVNCMVLLNVQDGVALGILITTAGSEQAKTIEGLLNKKYHGPGGKRPSLICHSNITGAVTEVGLERYWRLPGLYVSYSSIDSCPTTTVLTTGNSFVSRSTAVRSGTQGKITIELSMLRNLRSDVPEREAARQPSL